MRWLRALGAVPLVLIGLFLAMASVMGARSGWSDFYDVSIPALIPLLIVFAGTAVGGVVVLYVGVGLLRRNIRSRTT
jgi:hypothetical protein